MGHRQAGVFTYKLVLGNNRSMLNAGERTSPSQQRNQTSATAMHQTLHQRE